MRSEGMDAPKENLLAVRVNGVQVADNQTVVEWEPGRLFVSAAIFRMGRLRFPPQRPTHVPGLDSDYYPVDSIAGVRYAIDASSQTLEINAPASAFSDTAVDALGNPKTKATRPEPGVFLNHDFQLLNGAGQRSLSGLVEAGFFSRLGVLTTEFAGPDLTNGFTPRRLTTQFFRDFPESMTTLTLGDSFSAVSPWARTVSYLGARWASNFATQPSFLSTPLPTISGQASQPSTVDVYIDNVKRLSQPVETGPFSIQNVPVISGQGEIRMVVTDVLGRQQVITESYIRASNLLRAGVNDFTYEAGTVRLDYGIKSNDYHSFFAAATQRRGITNALTLEGRMEAQPNIETAGFGAVYAIRSVGVLAGGGAASMDFGHPGELFYGQFSRSQRSFSFAGQIQRATVGFRQVGLLENQQATRMLLQAQVSKSLWSGSSIAAGYLRRDGRTEQNARALTFSLNVRLRRAFLTVGGTDSLLPPRRYGVNLALVVPLGERTISMATADMGSSGLQAAAEVNRSIPLGPGYGYRVRATELAERSGPNQEKNEAAFYYQTTDGFYGIEAGQQGLQTSVRLLERGSFVFVHKHLLVSRWLDSSFGVVEVPDTKGVPVYVNNQMLAKTDRRGLALLPWMVPYNRNTVRLDDSSLPVDVSVDQEERTVVPMARSAVFLQYKAAESGGATLILTREDGQPLPQGALVTVNGEQDTYEVELRGEVFVLDVRYPAAIHAQWDGGACDLRIAKPPADTPVPRIGPLACKGAK
jgi:outer membrane usher protein